MSDNSTPTSGEGSNRAARTAMRQQLRRNLLEGRARLRQERDLAATAAAHRPPRWRPTRQDDLARSVIPATTGPSGIATETLESPVPTTGFVEGEPDIQQDVAPGEAASVFASIMADSAERLTQQEDASPCAPIAAPETMVAAPPVPDMSFAPACAEPAATVTALGPGMLARLRLLGYAQITDLATADADQLRAGLGDISRLLNVEGWIADARRVLSQ